MSYLASWSGGKDCCMAYWEAQNSGLELSGLFNTLSVEYDRVRFHGTEARLLQLQAEAMGVPVLQATTADGSYTEDFKRALRPLPPDVTGMVFGDMYNDLHLEWVQGVCADLGLECVEPLWGRDPNEVLCSFLDAGFEAMVVCVDGSLLEESWVGTIVDHRFREHLLSRGLDPCGEKGEYHTMVVNGPLFQRRVEIRRSRIVEMKGFFLLDTQEYGLGE
ncbi:MAG TPA: diphthine--ammonia ligase [Armatimonadota bacterium]|jgi:uncharacterized protein (TIGR00290 family)